MHDSSRWDMFIAVALWPWFSPKYTGGLTTTWETDCQICYKIDNKRNLRTGPVLLSEPRCLMLVIKPERGRRLNARPDVLCAPSLVSDIPAR